MDVPWWLLLLGLEFPALMALIDCSQRSPDHFAGGAPDRAAWLKWLVIGVITVPVLLGYGVVLGYYFSVIRRNAPTSRG